MTITSEVSRTRAIGNGSTATYSFTFKVASQAHLQVTVRSPDDDLETELTLTTDYTVTLNANGTGSITLVDSNQDWIDGSGYLDTDWVIVIRRVVPLKQETDIRNQGAFYPEAHEDAFDYAIMAVQQVKDEVDRSFKVAETDDPLTLRLPSATERASQFLGFDASGEPIAAAAVSEYPVSSFMQTVLDDTTASAARTTLGFTGALATTGSVDTTAIDADAVTNAKLANMSALSIKGNGTNASANPTDLAAANDYEIIQRVGTAVAFGPYKVNYRNATTTDSIATTDDVVIFSGASFTATLPTAVGNKGKKFILVHQGTSFTQAYTLNTTSGQTIGGLASGVFIMQTNGEYLEIVSDGANYTIILHKAITSWVDAGVMTITGTSSNPTKATTREYDRILVRRNGKYLKYWYLYQAASATGAAAGSGAYKFLLPYSHAIDTTIQPVNTDISWGMANATPQAIIPTSNLAGQNSSTNTFTNGRVKAYDANNVIVWNQINLASQAWIGSASNPLTSTNLTYNFEFEVPITGFQGF